MGTRNVQEGEIHLHTCPDVWLVWVNPRLVCIRRVCKELTQEKALSIEVRMKTGGGGVVNYCLYCTTWSGRRGELFMLKHSDAFNDHKGMTSKWCVHGVLTRQCGDVVGETCLRLVFLWLNICSDKMSNLQPCERRVWVRSSRGHVPSLPLPQPR